MSKTPPKKHGARSDGEEKRGEYKVGRGCPPKHTQFKPGQSGNPKGRRRRNLTFGEQIDKELNLRISVQTNGKTKRMTKRDVMVSRLVNMAIGGDIRAVKCLIDLSLAESSAPGSGQDVAFPTDSASFLKDFLKRQELGDAIDGLEATDVVPPALDAGADGADPQHSQTEKGNEDVPI